jgi:hypothetical protein
MYLGFFLASWGMYRASSFLIDKDCTVHADTLELLSRPELYEFRDCSFAYAKDHVDELIRLTQEVLRKYQEHANNCEKQRNATITLATKVILGVLGCLPAYDRYFINGIKRAEQQFWRFRESDLRSLLKFASEHEAQFEEARLRCSKDDTDYPPMKLLDMYFWQIGFSEELRERNT